MRITGKTINFDGKFYKVNESVAEEVIAIMKKKVFIITLVLGMIGIALGIHVNLKAAIGIIGGADGPTAIFIGKNTEVDIEEINAENVGKEWTTQKIAELFKTNAD